MMYKFFILYLHNRCRNLMLMAAVLMSSKHREEVIKYSARSTAETGR